jgi:hypothetical protein
VLGSSPISIVWPVAAIACRKVSNLGFDPDDSSRAIADCVVLSRCASSAWVRPEARRARFKNGPGAIVITSHISDIAIMR